MQNFQQWETNMEPTEEQLKSWAFDASDPVLELRNQLDTGLISTVEFANKILDLWSRA